MPLCGGFSEDKESGAEEQEVLNAVKGTIECC